jgi:hypothetical protein
MEKPFHEALRLKKILDQKRSEFKTPFCYCPSLDLENQCKGKMVPYMAGAKNLANDPAEADPTQKSKIKRQSNS